MSYLNILNGIDTEIMKKRLSYNGKKIYIKSLTSTYALVSYSKETSKGKFKVDVKELVEIK
jgi:hypothetical protein|tara:strand:+ start:2138 stop:2320 length:183 start_codon:yes stop_codon:yes gene_type:complete